MRALISGQPVQATVNVAANVSGNIVYLTSGHNEVIIANQPVTINGTVSTNVSGNAVRAQFFDPSGNVWRDPWVERSGGHKLQTTASGDAYTISNTVTIAGAVTTSVSGNNVVVLMSGGSMSGQSVLTSVSGNVVYLTSGQNSVQTSGQTQRIQAFDPSGNTWRDVWVNQSGGNRILVEATVQTTTNVSGQTVVAEVSGQKQRMQFFDPSGNTWRDAWVERSGGQRLLTSISGETILTSISGNTVVVLQSGGSASGQRVSTSGDAAVISGQPVGTSGQMQRVQAFDPSGNTWRDLWVSQSGGNSLLVTAQVTTNISGQTVVSEVSGQKIYIADDDSPTDIADVTTYNADNNSVLERGLRVIGHISAYDANADAIARIRVTNSGDGFKLIVSTSGQPSNVSGNYVSTSGSAVVISGQRVSVSGNVVNISGNTVVAELKVQNDAESALTNVKEYRSGSKGVLVGTFIPERLKAYPILYASAASGGTALDSGICARVTIRNIAQTSGEAVFVGFSGTNNSPFAQTSTSGRGFYLRDGDGVTIECDNPAVVRVVSATTSGRPISYFSVGDI